MAELGVKAGSIPCTLTNWGCWCSKQPGSIARGAGLKSGGERGESCALKNLMLPTESWGEA